MNLPLVNVDQPKPGGRPLFLVRAFWWDDRLAGCGCGTPSQAVGRRCSGLKVAVDRPGWLPLHRGSRDLFLWRRDPKFSGTFGHFKKP